MDVSVENNNRFLAQDQPIFTISTYFEKIEKSIFLSLVIVDFKSACANPFFKKFHIFFVSFH